MILACVFSCSRLDSSHGSSPENMSTEAQDEAAQLRQAKQTGMNQHIAELPAAELPDRPVRSQSSSFPRSAAAGPAGRQAGPPRRQQQVMTTLFQHKSSASMPWLHLACPDLFLDASAADVHDIHCLESRTSHILYVCLTSVCRWLAGKPAKQPCRVHGWTWHVSHSSTSSLHAWLSAVQPSSWSARLASPIQQWSWAPPGLSLRCSLPCMTRLIRAPIIACISSPHPVPGRPAHRHILTSRVCRQCDTSERRHDHDVQPAVHRCSSELQSGEMPVTFGSRV